MLHWLFRAWQSWLPWQLWGKSCFPVCLCVIWGPYNVSQGAAACTGHVLGGMYLTECRRISWGGSGSNWAGRQSNVPLNQCLETLHDNWCQRHRPVIIETSDVWTECMNCPVEAFKVHNVQIAATDGSMFCCLTHITQICVTSHMVRVMRRW